MKVLDNSTFTEVLEVCSDSKKLCNTCIYTITSIKTVNRKKIHKLFIWLLTLG